METLINGLDTEEKRVQSGSAELVSLMSEERPDLLASYFDKLIGNLERVRFIIEAVAKFKD